MSSRAAVGNRPGARFAQFKLVLLGMFMKRALFYPNTAETADAVPRGVGSWEGRSGYCLVPVKTFADLLV